MISIRPAKPTAEDARAFSELADMATSHLLGAVLGPGGLPVIESLFLLDRSQFSHRHVRFAMVGDRIAAMLCGLSDESSRENAIRSGLIQLRHLWWRLPAIIMRAWPLRGPIDFVNQSHPGQFYLPFVAVRPEFRRQGLARRLMREAEQMARAEGCRVLALSADPTAPAAMELYRSSGMREAGRSPAGRFRGRDETLVRMEKLLS